MPNQFAFISVGDPGRPSDVDRQIIRSHVMRGKNKRVGSRRSLREAAQQYATEDEYSTGSSGEDIVGACLRLERQGKF
ncbi:hypothetical protein LTR97_009483 [Elasticomyces elasticus]|uniref:Uncharacterized protein n=1 Tax=Elasticomyces elasticus TaxID=574655 RepID=A0AAN7WBL6_9PEZI|nr:hypothetical protein LTR97_009483 [Elasticomyces elasticus]